MIQDLISNISSHWHNFWFISAPAAASFLFLVGTLLYKAYLGSRREEDESSALVAVAHNEAVNGRTPKSLVVARNLFGSQEPDGVLVKYDNNRYELLEPKSASMSAVRYYHAKYEHANAAATIAIYAFATCMIAYVISWFVWYYMIQH